MTMGFMTPRPIKFRLKFYSGYQLSEVQEPHPQPPPRSSRGGYDVTHVIRKRYKALS